MESAYLYIRVSTDEQKRKGYSLPEQEDQLLKYCAHNNIEIKGIFSEDYSAKNFNRPEWKKLIIELKKSSKNEKNNILFIKWDRFSRNIEYAYEMIGLLRKYNTNAMAIDQPIDFSVPESTVMLAVYLSIPEAENTRRALNTINGLRRAKQLGRYPNRAPIGYINLTALDGRKYISPKQPEAGILTWVYQLLSTNSHSLEEVRMMASAKGLRCSRSYFWRLLQNPVYCGLVRLSSSLDNTQLVQGIHEPIVSEHLFYQVQNVILTKRRVLCKTDELKKVFFLKGYLVCPACKSKLRGSFSKGYNKKYGYYHCSGKCKIRVRAGALNDSYTQELRKMRLSRYATELFALVLEDFNIGTKKIEYLTERKKLSKQIDEQDQLLGKTRKLFVSDLIKFDDFSSIKNEVIAVLEGLNKELSVVNTKLLCLAQQIKFADRSSVDIFRSFDKLDLSDKKYLLSFFPVREIDVANGKVLLSTCNALFKILNKKKNIKITDIDYILPHSSNFADQKVTSHLAIRVLAKQEIQVDEKEAAMILNLMYIVAKTYSGSAESKNQHILKETSNWKKASQLH
jgi:site-specific DNA recombinase